MALIVREVPVTPAAPLSGNPTLLSPIGVLPIGRRTVVNKPFDQRGIAMVISPHKRRQATDLAKDVRRPVIFGLRDYL